MEIAVIGTGYVGLVAGVGFADAGHTVHCVDRDPAKITSLREGKSPIYEPGLEDLLERNRSRLHFTEDLASAVATCSVLFVAVGTPENPDGSAQMEPVWEVTRLVARLATSPKVFVLKSTVPVGSAKKVRALLSEHAKVPIEVVSNPEFLREGAAIDDFLSPDRVVIGCNSQHARDVMTELYRPFTLQQGKSILFMDNASAELTKYAANAFLSVKISFINELALLADAVGADIDSVRAGFTSDHRINPAFFNPGVGFGGSCFPKDVKALIHSGQQHDVPMQIVAAADEVNDRQKHVLFRRAQQFFGDLKGKRIALWGLAFKPSTDDVREAPALYLIEDFVRAGCAVVGYDPVAGPNARKACPVDFELADTALAAVRGADALLIVTEWNEFKNPNFEELKKTMRRAVIWDGRNILEAASVTSFGFEYFCMGKGRGSEASR